MIRGFAESLAADAEGGRLQPWGHLDGAAAARALAGAARVACSAVGEPAEGTMLTVIREAAEAALAAANREADTALGSVLEAAQAEAHRSVERTPGLLPASRRVREAGVVDAGGLGMAVILTGLSFGYSGVALPAAPAPPLGAVTLDAVEHQGHGYCTEFIVQGGGLDHAALDEALTAAGGESLLVVGDTRTLRVHVHIADPGLALSLGAAAGALDAVKVDNMQAQHERWAAAHEEGGAVSTPASTPASTSASTRRVSIPAVGLVAVVSGRASCWLPPASRGRSASTCSPTSPTC